MTEEEAKTKWCPHAVASHTDPRQRIEDRFLHQCIGSACMAWRWSSGERHHPTCANIASQLDLEEQPCDCDPQPAIGFCGLAGMPS